MRQNWTIMAFRSGEMVSWVVTSYKSTSIRQDMPFSIKSTTNIQSYFGGSFLYYWENTILQMTLSRNITAENISYLSNVWVVVHFLFILQNEQVFRRCWDTICFMLSYFGKMSFALLHMSSSIVSWQIMIKWIFFQKKLNTYIFEGTI